MKNPRFNNRGCMLLRDLSVALSRGKNCKIVQAGNRHKRLSRHQLSTFGPRQANLVLIAYASSEGSGEPAHPRSLARTFAARSYKQ